MSGYIKLKGYHHARVHSIVVVHYGTIAHGTIAHGTIAHGTITHGTIAHGTIAHGTIAHGDFSYTNCELTSIHIERCRFDFEVGLLILKSLTWLYSHTTRTMVFV